MKEKLLIQSFIFNFFQVRDQAFKTIKGFLEKLEKASENPETIPELEAQVNAGGSSLLSSDKVALIFTDCCNFILALFYFWKFHQITDNYLF